MDRTDESKKTVVAFVVGLLIGGLLVWIFSASPEGSDTVADTRSDDVQEDAADAMDTDVDTDTDASADDDSVAVDATPDTSNSDATVVTEGYSFSVADQDAGALVTLGDIDYPTVEGWIVVHEVVDEDLGNALGAARYNVSAGLTPDRVELLRGTESGQQYRVVFYTENGDRVFDLRDDVPMLVDGARIETSFTAL